MKYKDAGVDIEKGDQFVKNISEMVKSTHNKNVKKGIGGYSSLYQLGSQFIAATTDGVGTKLLLAKELEDYSSIGQDLVAMCANDLICVGANPLFFLDYYACGELDLKASPKVLASIAGACKKAELALVGGETAEMPGLYQKGDFDLAGFAVGVATEDELFKEENLKEGDILLALESSGFHSNGYSLLRKTSDLSSQEKKLLLEPTMLYGPIFKKIKKSIKASAHITGGGIENITRLSSNFDYEITSLPPAEEIPEIIPKIVERLGLSKKEAYSTFNMGMGMVLVVAEENLAALKKELQNLNCKHWQIGHLTKGKGEILGNFFK